MATWTCCRCSDGSWELYAAAALTWATRANAQQTALSIRQRLFIDPEWRRAGTQAAWSVCQGGQVPEKEKGGKKVSGCVWPRTGWHLLMDLDACMRMLCHQLSDLCPQWQIVTPGPSVIARVLHKSQTHAQAKRGHAVWARQRRNTRKEDKSSKNDITVLYML